MNVYESLGVIIEQTDFDEIGVSVMNWKLFSSLLAGPGIQWDVVPGIIFRSEWR